MFKFNIICTTIGRPTFERLLMSLENQLSKSDTLTIISDTNHEFVKTTLEKFKQKLKIHHIINEGQQLGKYGHPLINRYINALDGDFLMFADDDDRYVEGAFEVIKKTVTDKNKLYVFKHKWGNTINWTCKNFDLGNVGKCMGVIPNTHNLPNFREDVLGDVYFYSEISKLFESEFIDHIIYKVRDTI